MAGIWHEGRLAGAIGYDPIDWENRTTELGYWLGEEYQGKGLVTAACRALVEPAFGELSLNRVVISCATENKKSCAIPERLGFRREGVQRQAEWLYHHFVDHVVYAALASEWPTQPPSVPHFREPATCELRRTPSRRSSQNSTFSGHFGE